MEFPEKCTVLVKLYCHNAVNGFNSHVTGKFQFVKIGYDPTCSWDEELFKNYVRLFYTIRYHDFWIFRLSRTFETQVRHLRILRIAKNEPMLTYSNIVMCTGSLGSSPKWMVLGLS